VEPKVLKTVNLSDFPEGSFGKTNGLEITDGPFMDCIPE
jgi:peroxiredoxin